MRSWTNGRGRYNRSDNIRGRSSWRGGRRECSSGPAASVARAPSPERGQLLETIARSSLKESPEPGEALEISDCQAVASYSWLNGKEPHILVPGKPPLWTPLTESTRIPIDTEQYFRDPNAARYPAHPIEPSVRAIFICDPDFPSQEIDVFACASTIGNLLRFVRNMKVEELSFRFLVELVGHTVFFIRRENSPTEVIHGTNGFTGWGHTFPAAYTTLDEDVAGSSNHQRIIRYIFGDFDFVVRFEGDAYVPTKSNKQVGEGVAAELTDLMAATTLDSYTEPPITTKLKVKHGGQSVPHESVVEIKTRSIKNTDDLMPSQLPRFWVRQTPFLALGKHRGGFFNKEDVTLTDIRSEVISWQSEHQGDLHKLHDLLEKIVSFAYRKNDGKFEVVYKNGDELLICEQTDNISGVLPEDLLDKWMEADHQKETREPALAVGTEPDHTYHEAEERSESGEGASESGHNTSKTLPEDLWDDETEKDFTACSAKSCGYCGLCKNDA